MSTAQPTKLMTAEEFFALPEDGFEKDLIRGEVVVWGERVTKRNRKHSRTESRITYLLETWLDSRPEMTAGVYSGEAGFLLSRDPDIGVGIDVALAFASDEFDPESDPDDTPFVPVPPTIAVEILSPSEKREQTDEKVELYLQAGVPQVWLVDPHFRTVLVHRPDAEPVLFSESQELTGEPELPGFRVLVRKLFAR